MTCTADLHMHSCYSTDGEKSPGELVALSSRAGMDWIAVADHNRVDAVAEALRAGEAAGVRVIPAVELDCMFRGRELHVLAYHIDHTDPRYAAIWTDLAEQEIAASRRRMELVAGCGFLFDFDAVLAQAQDGIVTNELIAEFLLADPRNDDNEQLAPYRPGGTRSDNPYVNFYWDFCSHGKPDHVAIAYMTIEEGIRLIRDTGGAPVLAHPGQSLRNNLQDFPDVVRTGICGVEAYSSYHSPADCAYWADRARENNLLITCGSDYHGKTKPAIAIGGHGCPLDGEEMVAALRAAATA